MASSSSAPRRRSRKEQQQDAEDAALLTLNSLLQTLTGTVITIDRRDDSVVCGRLTRADNYMKCVPLRFPSRT